MHPILKREIELSVYLEQWITARYRDWNEFYHATNHDKRNGIYRLESGERLMDLLDDIIGNIEEHFTFEGGTHIIPSRFSSIQQALQFLENFNNYLKSKHYLIEKNLKGPDTDATVAEIYKICYEIDQMVTRCQSIYYADNNIPIPYQQAKSALANNNIKLFVELIGSLIANVPYNIHKEKLDEGYFHTIIHVITAVLGMTPASEVETNEGRIDMLIEYPNRIYIMEFKYSKDGKDRSQEALDQIKINKYAEGNYVKGKIIEGVGLSFSQTNRNVDHFVSERLYTPSFMVY